MRQVNTYDIREFWQLLKLMGYFRQHVDNFGKIAKPFYNLLKKLYIKGQVIPSPVAFSLQVVHQAELERLNHLFQCFLILNFNLFYKLFHQVKNQDALYEIQEGGKTVSRYGSCTLMGVGQKNHSSKLQFLAMKCAFYNHFKEYFCQATLCYI